jgi:dCMP deaminase
MSKCQSKQVCAIAVKNNRIIATGINGSLSGFKNCDEQFPNGVNEHNREEHHQWSLLYENHAEDNLVSEFAKNNISSIGATVYVNLQPCKKCTIRLAAIGITRIFYSKKYDKGNIEYCDEIFNHAGIEFKYINLNKD